MTGLNHKTKIEIKDFFWLPPKGIFFVGQHTNNIVITDITGRQMMRKTIRNNHNLDVDQLSNGVYFLFAEGTFIDRFVKQ